MSSPTTALQGETMLEAPSFSVILAVHPEVNGNTSADYSVLLTPHPIRVPAGRGLTVGRRCDEAAAHYDHVAIGQDLIGTLPVEIVPQRVLNLTPMRLPGGGAAVAASLSTSYPDYWSITSPGKRTGPDVWHRLYHDDEVKILRRDSTRDEWETFLRAKILGKSLVRTEAGTGTGTLPVEKAQREREARAMAGHLRRDLFAGDIGHWDPWAIVIAATTYLITVHKTDNLQDRLNVALDSAASGKPPGPRAANSAAVAATPQNTQFIQPRRAYRSLRRRYASLAPATLRDYSFEQLFGIQEPANSGDAARRLFYGQLLAHNIVTKDELARIAPYLGVEHGHDR